MDPRFSVAIRRVLGSIPRGRVASCGEVARALGDVRAARAVSAWVQDHPRVPGGHRVVRVDGRPVLSGAPRHLTREGVPLVAGRVLEGLFSDRVLHVDLLRRLRVEQLRLAAQVLEEDEPGPRKLVAGVDASYVKDLALAAAVLCRVDDLAVVQVARSRVRVDFPYISTYLGYREVPAIRAAVTRLRVRPDVLLVDGHGQLHPARFGVACQAGIALGLPTIGIAKHPLVGRAKGTKEPGGEIPIELDGQVRGYAWTPPRATRPIYVSVGHRISLKGALALVRAVTKERSPEPLRIADRWTQKMKGVKNGREGSGG